MTSNLANRANLATETSRRLTEPHAQQYLSLYLVALLFALFASWPAHGAVPNDSWFSLAYVRAGLLSLLGLGYGVANTSTGTAARRSTAAMLSLFALLALPLEVAAFAASYPAIPLAWLVVLPVPTVLAMFALGLVLGLFLDLIRLRLLAPLVVPAALVGLVMFDISVGLNLLNPLTAAVQVSLPHLAVILTATAALGLGLARRSGRG